ncbi:C6 zinc finger domain containing protein [Pyrenophora tritici-repentis]|nr:transcription factor Cys6 [Pyrenophora tritici-repentis]KAI1552926.1 C6 zinc finger domain containing protein [Pyrenophora tritici-repentis]KAI1588509.1 C6 zinc finger domain containing protein [Pyrenophora tritici-repentis]KAI1607127.1 C6 zinc finger domain containing protein [Pyrenophora tritici-repentis]PZD35422.1 C6 zinc finger domain containing protein [Pyrenophora tritici-repentis]
MTGTATPPSNNDSPGSKPLPTRKRASDATPEDKPKRTRTGCLTCRERHLKCDESKPTCHNCLKSQRECNWGKKLNFLDTTCEKNAYIIPQGIDYQVAFMDESRTIASEYVGGREMYPVEDVDSHSHLSVANNGFDMGPPAASRQHIPQIQGIAQESYQQAQINYNFDQQRTQQQQQQHARSMSNYSNGPTPSSYTMEHSASPGAMPKRDYLKTQEEVLYMQVFVEEIGIWMDSMDAHKHFSRLLPFHALNEPMLLHAFLACGARHLALVNPKYSEEKALHYYDVATRDLLHSLQDPDRDTILCATTAVILNVYEIMGERALQRMNHIAGARALIKECRWNARSTGIGAACFWLNVGMEILSCLHFNWQVAWDPDEWGIEMDFTPETESGKEEVWTHRILYVVARICNFRASIPRNQDIARQTLQERHNEWLRLKDMADRWNDNIPRTMHPMAYLYPGQTISGSAFPEVWLIKRASIIARLFYHTSMVLLAQINPIQGPSEPEMWAMLEQNSKFVCGISAHVKDRGVASVALRSLAIAAEPLTDRREQEEVLQIFDKIRQETGWRVGFVNTELKQKWVADFSMPQHPYQTHYVPANIVQQQHPPTLLQPPLNGVNGYGGQHFF